MQLLTATETHMPYMGSHRVICHPTKVTFPPLPQPINPLGGILPSRRTFYPVALKPMEQDEQGSYSRPKIIIKWVVTVNNLNWKMQVCACSYVIQLIALAVFFLI